MVRGLAALLGGAAWFLLAGGAGEYVQAVLGALAVAACAVSALAGRRDPIALVALGVGAALLAVALNGADVVEQATPAEALFAGCAGMLFAFGAGTPTTVVAVPLLVAGIDLASVLAGGDGLARGGADVLTLALGHGDAPGVGLLDAVFVGAFAAWALDYDLHPRAAVLAMAAGLAAAVVLALALDTAIPTLPFIAAGFLVPSMTRIPHLLRSEG